MMEIKETFIKLFGIEPRPEQLRMIEFAMESQAGSTLLNAGTGLGKSLAAICIAYMSGGGYVVPPTRILQWQYEADPLLKGLFESGEIALLLGKSNYPCMLRGCINCDKYDTKECTDGVGCLKNVSDDDEDYYEIATCASADYDSDCGKCRHSMRNIKQGSVFSEMCYHHAAKLAAQRAVVRVVNPAILQYAPFIFGNSAKMPVVLYDEAHGLDGFYRMLLEHGLFSKKVLKAFQQCDKSIPVKLNRYGAVVSTEEYLRHYFPNFMELVDHHITKTTKNIPDLQVSMPTAHDIIIMFKDHIEKAIESVSTDYTEELREALSVANKILENTDRFRFKIKFNKHSMNLIAEPLLVSFMHPKVGEDSSIADKEILMSATIFEGYHDRVLGLSNVAYETFDNHFPAKNSRIWFVPESSAASSNRSEHLQWAVEKFNSMLPRIPKRCLIHTISKESMRYIEENIQNDIRNRIFVVNSPTEFRSIFEEYKAKSDGILISASLGEGIDLKDDLCEWVFILSLSMPSPASAMVAGYNGILRLPVYDYQVSSALCQQAGRAIRSETDSANIVIMDNRIASRMKSYYKFMPPQWQRAFKAAKTVKNKL